MVPSTMALYHGIRYVRVPYEANARALSALAARMPSTPEAWSALGSFLLGTGRSAEARPLLQKAASARAMSPGAIG